MKKEDFIKKYGKANQHMYGSVKVIEILEGKIIILSEEEIKQQEEKN
jgi:hypothetical protein